MNQNEFKIGCTPNGSVYVRTGAECDAQMLDGQKFVGFGVEISFYRVTDIADEPFKASDEMSAFKLFKRN
jgi:hypothetical protein